MTSKKCRLANFCKVDAWSHALLFTGATRFSIRFFLNVSEIFAQIQKPTGNICDYPRFKTDFTKHVQSQIQKQETTTCTSKSCLIDIPYDLVNNVEDDLDEMWKILDDRYGSTSKLTESIMQDIKRTKPIKEDGEKFVEKLLKNLLTLYREHTMM